MLLAIKTFILFFYAPIGAETAHTVMNKTKDIENSSSSASANVGSLIWQVTRKTSVISRTVLIFSGTNYCSP
jgi:hypothetical protein